VTAVTAGNGVVVTASLGAANGKSTVTVTTPTGALTGLSIPVAPFIYTGQAWDPTTWADAAFANGTGQHPYSYATWTVTACSPANAAWVDANGWIYGNAAGTCTITAHSGALNSAPSTLTIADPALVTIVVTPATLSVAAGSSIQLSAVGTFSDGSQRDITSTATWASPTPGVATVGTTGAGTPGLVTGVAAGSVSIAASGITKTLPLTKTFAYSAVTVPASAPVQSTVTQPVVWDNTASISSLNSSWQKTTYSVNAFHTNSIAVGCNWFLMYDPIAGMNIQNLNCAESLVKFDIAALAGKTVVSATLRLQTDIYGVGYVPRTWYVHALAASWSGTSVTWDNAPGQYYVASVSNWNPPTATNQTYNIDVTNTVRNWVSGTWPNNGFVFGLNDLSFPYMISFDAFEFYSSEDPGGRGPKLVVTYQ
jgi:hypothetical protein